MTATIQTEPRRGGVRLRGRGWTESDWRRDAADYEAIPTAYHEAGHVVVLCRRFGAELLEYVTIEPRRDVRDGATTLDCLGHISMTGEPRLHRAVDVDRRIEVALAGIAAEARKAGEYNAAAARDDIESACVMARGLAESDDAVAFRVMRCNAQAREIVAELWPAVRIIARALLDRKTLTRRDVVGLVGARCER